VMEEDDAPKDSAVRTTVENIKSWIGTALRAVDAVEVWGGIVVGVLFAIAAIVAAIIAAFPVVKSWFG
jgi:hypothetical protein